MQLPVFQNFDCHSCGYCCRNLVVNITPQEHSKILDAGWEKRIPDQPLFIHYRFGGRRLIRLAHRSGGACVFLGDDNRCRLHAETGVATKPLACRLYPFVPTPGVGSVRLDLRADCPSVASNQGRSVNAHRSEIAMLAQETATPMQRRSPPWHGTSLDVAEFEALVKGLDDCLREGALPLRSRIRAGAHFLDLLSAVRLARVRGERFIELTRLLVSSAVQEATAGSANPPSLSPRLGRLLRQWLFLHAIADDPEELSVGTIERFRRSWQRYGQSRRFACGQGSIPSVRPDWPATTFEAVQAAGLAPDAMLEPLVRSMRVKLEAHAFAGPGYFGYELIPGLAALFLLPAVVGWFARLAAVASGRTEVSGEDVLTGVRQAHHTFGVSPVFSRISERLRLRGLAQPGVPLAALALYGP